MNALDPATAPAATSVQGPPAAGAVAASPPVRMSLLYVWMVLYGFVGTQLGWTLRPFFGDPGAPFALFRRIEGNFYVNVLESLVSIFR